MKTSFSRELDIKKKDGMMAILIILKDNGPEENRMEKDCFMQSMHMVKNMVLSLVFLPMTYVKNKAID